MKRLLLIKSDKSKSSTVSALIKTLYRHFDRNIFQIYVTSFDDLSFFIGSGKVKVFDNFNKKSLNSFSGVIFRLRKVDHELALACSIYLKANKVPFWNSELGGSLSRSKLSQYMLLAQNGLKLPQSFYASPKLLKHFIDISTRIKLPCIMKSIHGQEGLHNFLISSPAQVTKILKAYPKINYILQQYIPNDHDFKIICVNFQPVLFIKRTPKGSTHLNNISAGAAYEFVKKSDFPKYILDQVSRAVKLMKRELAGVDVIVDLKSKQHYILEVNSSPVLNTDIYPKFFAETLAKEIKHLIIKQ